jgi:putative flippase GtrA
LRGIPLSIIANLLRLKTNGYDFELDMLLLTKSRQVSIVEVPIETVYLDENSSSHFNPLLDSLKIYLVFLRFNLSSLVSVVIDFSVFSLIISLGHPILAGQFSARFCAGFVNYFLNKSFVFKSDRDHKYSILSYVAVLVGMGLCSYGLILVLSENLGISVFASKICSELFLYLASFALQREFVFSQKEHSS